MYPALAVLNQFQQQYPAAQILWVGVASGMEADLVQRAGIEFEAIPAAGVHGVGLRRLPGNGLKVMRGFFAARKVLQRFKPDVLFFTGGYVAPPMALAGLFTPKLLYVPDIEPGLALKALAFFATEIAVTAPESRQYFQNKKTIQVTGYPLRELLDWDCEAAYAAFGFSADLPTLVVTGGSLGSLSINRAVTAALPVLLQTMQIIHITGQKTWETFQNNAAALSPELAGRYYLTPYLHEKMGAAFTIADLVVSRAGASSIGEYPHFGIPAILVPYPYAWRYQKVNADYLTQNEAAILLEDRDLEAKLATLIVNLMQSDSRRTAMQQAMKALEKPGAALQITNILSRLASKGSKL